ncbi:MAG: hypothetical protein ACOX4D_02870 [Bacteroidales bacterium]
MKINNNIKKLLKKYYNGETSIDEEKFLKNYFSENKVDNEFLIEKIIFDENIDCSVDLTNEIEKFIDIFNEDSFLENKNNASFNKLPSKKIEKTPKNRIFNNRIIVALAASLIIMITVGIHLLINDNTSSFNKNISTYNGIAMTQEEVYQTVTIVFDCVSDNLYKPKIQLENNVDKAYNKLKTINDKINKVNK